jgi:peptidoglycan/LPS O-acetylase OafA/YrhL
MPSPLRFAEFEGLRGWLAWSVVGVHLVQWSGLSDYGLLKFFNSGRWAVEVFVILSGFVITHLLLTRKERFGPFLIRRIFRIVPVYLPMMLLGGATLYLALDALPHMAWAGPDYAEAKMLRSLAAAQEHHFLAQLIAHLTLLHGIPPKSVLPLADSTFLTPAWSLTLEMQFYIVAPFVVAAIQRRKATLAVILLVTFALFAANLAGWFGERRFPSFLPAEGPHFLLGILTRLWWTRIQGTLRAPAVLATILFLGAGVSATTRPAMLWLAVVAMIAGRCVSHSNFAYALFDSGTLSRVAQWAGSRSYSVYVAHLPIIQICAWVIVRNVELGQWSGLLVVGSASVAATIVVAEVLHRTIELPMMRVGANLAREIAGPKVAGHAASDQARA